jgi:DNA polymerase-3 subunit delta'
MKSVFDNLVDQDFAISTLKQALTNDLNLPHAWIFTGPPGCGLHNAIFAFTAALICKNNGCGECSDCQDVNSGGHPDVELLDTAGLSIKVSEIRELIEKSNWAPSISKRRVLVINETERLTESASNALLRAIEEPNQNIVWLLSSESIDALSPTIKSRCVTIRFKAPSINSISEKLIKDFGLEIDKANKISIISNNDLVRAENLANNKDLLQFRNQVLEKLMKLKNLSGAFELAKFIVEQSKNISEKDLETTNEREIANLKQSWGSSRSKMISGGSKLIKELEKSEKGRVARKNQEIIEDILTDIFSFYRDCILVKNNIDENKGNFEFADELQKFSHIIDINKAIQVQTEIIKSKNKIRANSSPLLVLESLLAQCA